MQTAAAPHGLALASRRDYRDEQVDEIIRTELTRSFWADEELLLAEVPLVVLDVVPPLVAPDELLSRVPVISTS